MTDLLASDAERCAQVRALYAAGHPLKQICAQTRLSSRRVYFWLDHDVDDDGRPRRNPMCRRLPGSRGEPGTGARRHRALARRIWRAAEAQVREIETRLAALGAATPADTQRDARALAVLARVLRDLAALDGDKTGRSGRTEAASEETGADAFSDLDTFRRELARRLDALRGGARLRICSASSTKRWPPACSRTGSCGRGRTNCHPRPHRMDGPGPPGWCSAVAVQARRGRARNG